MALEAVLNGQKAKSKEEVGSTLRFVINLDSPNDSTTNEVCYTDLVSEKTRKHCIDELDPLGDGPESQIAAIAKRLEEKYAPSKKSRKVREEDLVDLGYGYDLNDPFVDDAEVYEDFVPHQVDTMYGGFYINMGSLEFKKAEGTEDLPLKRKQKPSIKKQSSLCTPKALLASKKIKLAKQQIATSAQRSQNIKKKLSSLQQKSLFPSTKQSNSSSKETKVTGAVTIGLKESSLGIDESSTTTENGKGLEPQASQTPPPFPSDLPPEIESRVRQIETMIEKEDGKLTIKARYAYDSILLEIESECKAIKMKKRSGLYDYLAYRLGMTKGSLMTRIKRTIKKKEAGSIDSPLQRFKEALDEVIPQHIAKYNADMAAYELALKAEQESVRDGALNVSKEDDFVSNSKLPIDAASKPKKPRRTFRWTPKLRSLLCEVVHQKVEAELANKNRMASGEEVILNFLETVVKPLWPKGWFVKRNLYNITQSVHTELTGYQQKKALVKKEKLAEVKVEEGSLLVPPPPLTTHLPLPNEGSTQASFGSIMESISAPKLSASPPIANTPLLAPNVVSPKPVITSGTMSTVTANLKPTLVSSSRQNNSSSPLLSANSSVPIQVKDKQKPKSSKSTKHLPSVLSPKKDKVARTDHASFSTSLPTSSGSTQHVSHVTTNPGIQSHTPCVTMASRKPAAMGVAATDTPKLKSPLNVVLQKGPTKVAKITPPPGVVLSKEEIDTIINTLKNKSISLTPQQQLQVLLQHSPQAKTTAALHNQSQTRPSVSLLSSTSPSKSLVSATAPGLVISNTSGVQTKPSLSATGISLVSQPHGGSGKPEGGSIKAVYTVANLASPNKVARMQSKSTPTTPSRIVSSTPSSVLPSRTVSAVSGLSPASLNKPGTVSSPIVCLSSSPLAARSIGTNSQLNPRSNSGSGTGSHHLIHVVPSQASRSVPAVFTASHLPVEHNYAPLMTTPTRTIPSSQTVIHDRLSSSVGHGGPNHPAHSQTQGSPKKN